mgnify:CR=1 FL=1
MRYLAADMQQVEIARREGVSKQRIWQIIQQITQENTNGKEGL